MTTTFQFTPSQTQLYQFSPVLDGQNCTAIVTWNVSGGRWYVNLYDEQGALVFCLPLIGSDGALSLQALSWTNGTVTGTTLIPHGYGRDLPIDLTISGATPDGYNGAYRCLITGRNMFTYSLQSNPGQAANFGSVSYDISLTAGYFDSTLVFRQANQQFEVSP